MPVRPVVPARLASSPFRGSAAVRRGLLTPDQLAGPTWRPLYRDVYVHRDVPMSHELRARAVGCLLLPGAVVTGRSAAVLWGVPLSGADDAVEVTRPPGSHPVRVPGLVVRRARLPVGSTCARSGVRTTTPAATALRLGAALTGDDGVVAIDQLVAAGVTGLAEVRALAVAATGPGCARARRAAVLADGLAGSPQETRLRLLMARAGLPAPRAQHVVRDAAGFVARVDFGWPELRLAVEYDGVWHGEPRQFARDRQRLNRLQAAGWRVLFVTAADLRDPERLLAALRAALGVA